MAASKKIFLSLIACILLFIGINTFYQSKKEYNSHYHFVITKIDITPTKSLEFYDVTAKYGCGIFILSIHTT